MDAHGVYGTPLVSPSSSPARQKNPIGSPTRGVRSNSGNITPLTSSLLASGSSAISTSVSPAPLGVASSTTSPSPPRQGLLVPTDRPLDDFEEKWLPRLGRLRVDREVRMKGYALYAIRGWYLSRSRWAATIAAYTGKPTESITCYVLVPAAGLSPKAGEAELAAATQYLAGETRAQPRNTDHGPLLVSTPAGFGQDIVPIPSGDLRETWPFIVLNTALRRLGCGGRAAMGNDSPVAAVRRKFYESYRIPTAGTAGIVNGTQSRAGSPPLSPTYPTHAGHARATSASASASPSTGIKGRKASLTGNNETDTEHVTAAALNHDAIMLSVVELVKLIQGALAIWGLFGSKHEEIEIDGLFCDETKAGLFAWRRAMGMEREESLRLERETSGGCIDPRTLAALLSSITSTRYQLDALAVEKLPKDPFLNPRRFLQAWKTYQTTLGKQPTSYLTVAGIRQLHSNYVGERRGHAADAFKVPRVLFSGVASAASGVHATLKGGTTEDSTPIRKREQHLRFSGDKDDSGVELIIPEGEVGTVVAPDVITTGLEAYIKGVLRSREKDWDVMGARRVAELWNGTVAECDSVVPAQSRLRVFARRPRGPMRDLRDDDDEDSSIGRMGAIRGVSTRAGNKLKDLGRRALTSYDTSDSEAGKPAARRPVPTVIEPEEADEPQNSFSPSRSPSPAIPMRTNEQLVPSPMRPGPGQSAQLSLNNNLRLSVATNLSGEMSDGPSQSLSGPRAPDTTTRRTITAPSIATLASTPLRARALAMARTVSDGADVIIGDGGHEWEIANPHGTGKREDADGRSIRSSSDIAVDTVGLKRMLSYQNRAQYRDVHVNHPKHLAIDVELIGVVWKLRKRERMLAKRADDMAALERSAFQATQTLYDTSKKRRERLAALEDDVRDLKARLHHASTDAVDEDRALQWASSKLLFFLSEDTNSNELSWGLRELERHWEELGSDNKGEKGDEEAKPKRWCRLM